MDPSESTPHRKNQPQVPRSQVTSLGSTSGLDKSSLEGAKCVVVPNLQVVDPETFLAENFGKVLLSTAVDKDIMKLSFSTSNRPESKMYPELTDIFNKILGSIPVCTDDDYVPKKHMKCLNISSVRFPTGQQSGHNATLGPDLFLTFDPDGIPQATEKKETKPTTKARAQDDDDFEPPGGVPIPMEGKSPEKLIEDDTKTSIWYRAGITIEVKSKRSHDIDIHSSSEPKDRPDFASMSKNVQDLVRQSLGYTIHGQWPTLPYRFIWSMTITGDVLRIWRWGSTGAMVTDAIEYEKDPECVLRFLQAVAGGPYSHLGIDIGSNRTFRGVVDNQEGKTKLEQLTKLYTDMAYPSHMETLRRWSVKANLGYLLQFNIPEDRVSVGEANPAIKSYILISTPINDVVGLFTRSTRVYLAISKTDFDGGKFNASHLRSLKLSWQSVLRHPEIEFYKKVSERRQQTPIKYLAEAIVGGSFAATLEKNGRFLRCGRNDSGSSQLWASFVSPLPTQPEVETDSTVQFSSEELSEVYCQGMRELQWILFKDVGRPLQAFEDLRDLIQALSHALDAYHALLEIKILHRDISQSNVMVNLVENTGLLIDLDMARDLDEPKDGKFKSTITRIFPAKEAPKGTVTHASKSSEAGTARIQGTYLEQDAGNGLSQNAVAREPITGTLHYLSAAVERDPDRQEWHDLESFFWLLVWIVIRHSPTGELRHTTTFDLSDPDERENALVKVFPFDNLGPRIDAIQTMSTAKRDFLAFGSLHLPGAREVQILISQLQNILGDLYQALSAADKLEIECKGLVEICGKHNVALTESAAPTTSNLDPSIARLSFSGSTELNSLLANVLQHATSLRDTCAQIKNEEVQAAAEDIFPSIKRLQNAAALIEDHRVPDYQTFRLAFDRALNQEVNNRTMKSIDYESKFNINVMNLRTVPRPKSLAAKPDNSARIDLLARLSSGSGSGRGNPRQVISKRKEAPSSKGVPSKRIKPNPNDGDGDDDGDDE